MKFNRIAFQFSIIVLLPFISCERTIIEQVGGSTEGKVYSIEGYAQKGPFIIGTDVTVAELNEKLFPTGRVFFSTILDDEGKFKLPGVVLESPYIQIKVKGRYFSETGGYVPSDELTLYSLADITKSETVNVNIFTHLEKERVEYLVQDQNYSFKDAKEKARNEILKLFEWDNFTIGESESLDLTSDNTGGAILLALSAIFENIEFVKRIETLTNFRVDLGEDGILDDKAIQNRLRSSAAMVNTFYVRENLETKYGFSMPDFESYVDVFVTNSSFRNYFDEIFPESKNGKVNLLRYNSSTLTGTEFAVFVSPLVDNEDVIPNFSEASFSFMVYYPSDPTSSFETPSYSWIQAETDQAPCDSPVHICLKAVYYNVFDNSSDLEIPVSVSGNGYYTLSIMLEIDGILYNHFWQTAW